MQSGVVFRIRAISFSRGTLPPIFYMGHSRTGVGLTLESDKVKGELTVLLLIVGI